MGRKNNRARTRFVPNDIENLQNATSDNFMGGASNESEYDLSTGDIVKKRRNRASSMNSDCTVSLYNTTKESCKHRPNIIFRDAAFIKKHKDSGMLINRVRDRLYFIKDDGGYPLTCKSECGNYHYQPTLNVTQVDWYKSFCGDHNLQYDFKNEAFYITKEE